ncbi:M3 family oligoendopeptidase [Anaerocolumna sp. AGMB13025]|uniref:M3 family oligoendopeptidase n=1 Tax=Anaerocolumna sp. AGMB13025 TaxID=3039116 RepID=UPI00241E96C0|nr:M3 family oligoendopeptidase [Anaerocolumna sp. AGMB13025]WFR59221.1 M3 family oligoendopeptidase [Anaerocolumna sp. AGMB13025]
MKDFTFSTLEYVRPDFELLEKESIKMAEEIRQADKYEQIKDVLERREKLNSSIDTMATIAYIRNTLNTTDEFYESEIEFIDERGAAATVKKAEVSKALLESRFREEMIKDLGKEYLVAEQRFVDQFKEELVPFMQQEAKLTTRYQKLMATAQIDFDGQILNLYGIQKYFENPDREVRKGAFKAFSDFYHKNEEEMEEIFDQLIKIRNEMGRSLGFDNFIPLGYMQQERSDYGQKEVAAFREQVRKEIVPLCQEIYNAQAKRIGVDKIMAYDEKFVFPDGNAIPAGDEEYLVAEAQKMYHDMSTETGEFIDFMIAHELMDLKNKPNKAATGYMTSLLDYKAPYVFSCFNHTIFDMQVLSHELGHAFAGYEAMRTQKTSQYYSVSTDIAEIHSMAMEQFAYPYAEQFFGEDADKFRFAHLQEAFTFVPFGVAVDEFQHIVYANPELTPKERTFEWHKLEEKYMPWRAYEEDEFMERGGFWYYKLHIFLYPFYYINYTLTTMGAMEFKQRYHENKEQAWKDYLALCKAGSSTNYLNLLKLANLSVPFEEGSVAKSIAYAKEELLSQIKGQDK